MFYGLIKIRDKFGLVLSLVLRKIINNSFASVFDVKVNTIVVDFTFFQSSLSVRVKSFLRKTLRTYESCFFSVFLPVEVVFKRGIVDQVRQSLEVLFNSINFV